MNKKNKAKLDDRDEELRRQFYRIYPRKGLVGLHGALSDDPFGERAYVKELKHQPIPASQRER